MCQACYDKGFKDYPVYDSKVAHIEDYKRGYKTRQNESLDTDELQHTFFCEKCYERGLSNSRNGLWAPPVSNKRGHYESYEKGYNQVEMEEANKIPGYYLPENEVIGEAAKPQLNKNLYVLAGIGALVLLIAAFMIYRFAKNGAPTTETPTVAAVLVDTAKPAAPVKTDTVAVAPPPAVRQEAPPPAAAPAQEPPKESSPAAKEPEKVVEKTKQKLPEPIAKPEKTEPKPKPVKTEPVVAPNATAAPNTGKLLTEDDLKGMNKQQLKLMRNEIFARHGYIFKSPDMNTYFRQKTWYKPEHEDVNKMLTPEERQNVELIKKMEH